VSNLAARIARPASALALSILLLVSGCASVPSKPVVVAEGQIPLETRVDGERVHPLRSYVDDVKTADGERRLRFDYVWNYSRGLTQQFSYETDGRLVDITDFPEIKPSASEAEREWARRILAADARTAVVSDPAVRLYGGFIHFVHDDPVCGQGSRCVRMFGAREDGRHVVFHVYVDLMKGQVVATDVDPEFRGIGDSPGRKK
jgi:hypothetical protein